MIDLPAAPSRLMPSSNGAVMVPNPVGDYIRVEQYNLLRFQATTMLDDNIKMLEALKKVKAQDKTSRSLYDKLSSQHNELLTTLRQYLSFSSLDGRMERQSLRQKLQSFLVPDTTNGALTVGDCVFIQKYVGTENAFAEISKLDPPFVYVSNAHWIAGAGSLEMHKLFETETKYVML